MRLVPKLLLPIILIAVSLVGASYLRATKPAVDPSPEVERVWTVRATAVDHRDHQPTLRLYGELVAGRDVTIRPDVAGKVIEASSKLFDGGRFEQGETILKIDPFDYRAAIDELKAQQREAKARQAELVANKTMEEMTLELDQEQLALVGRDVERYQRLSDNRTASEKAFDEAKIALSQQTGTVQQRRQSVIMLDARMDQQEAAIARLDVALRRAERDLQKTEIKAPFSGFITDVDAQIGKQLSKSDSIARLIDDRKLEISFQLADADFGRLWQNGLIGREITGRWRLGETAFDLTGEVARVVATIDSRSGGVTVYAGITSDLSGIPLRPGAFIEVEMQDKLYENVVALPASALFAGDTVFVVEDDRLRPETVALVATDGGDILIDADLADGVPIVTSRLAGIAPGLKVKVAE
ncbi:MAG: efflux RND transporter periplasmic adaptor subunit [Geminicoccales bacterium]